MSRISIDIGLVQEANQELVESLSELIEAKNQISSLNYSLSEEVRKRRGIQNQINKICSDIEQCYMNIRKIINTVDSALNTYAMAEADIYIGMLST